MSSSRSDLDQFSIALLGMAFSLEFASEVYRVGPPHTHFSHILAHKLSDIKHLSGLACSTTELPVRDRYLELGAKEKTQKILHECEVSRSRFDMTSACGRAFRLRVSRFALNDQTRRQSKIERPKWNAQLSAMPYIFV